MKPQDLVRDKKYIAKTKKGDEVVIFNKEKRGLYYFNHQKDTVVQVRTNTPQLENIFYSGLGTVYSLKNIFEINTDNEELESRND